MVENRIEKRLNGWKGQMLSVGARVVLINSVLTSLPMFIMSFMSFFELLRGTLEKIDFFTS
jgi:hypothetical protein